MNRKLEAHEILGLSIEQCSNICDELLEVFNKKCSLREVIEFVNNHYDSKSIVAGMMLNIILNEKEKKV